MTGVCDMCGASYVDFHQCRVRRGETVIVTQIVPPLPTVTHKEMLRAMKLFSEESHDIELATDNRWPM